MKTKMNLKLPRTPELYENSFDYFRIFAAVQVLLGHIVLLYNVNLSKPLKILLNMFEGVPILFTLCGFLVTASFVKSSDTKEYFRKRVFRIFPPLWVSVAVGFVILWIFMGSEFPVGQAAVWTVLQGFAIQYTPGFAESFGSGTFNGALWALFTEFQFYLMLPVFYKIMKNRRCRTWIIVGVILFAAFAVSSDVITDMNNQTVYFVWKRFILSQIMYFYIGSFVCVFKDRILPFLKKFFPCLVAVYALGFVLHSCIGLGFLYYLLQYCLLPFVIIGGGYWFKEHRLKIDISYGIYLYHVMVINVFLEMNSDINIITAVMIILISIACGFASAYVDKLFRMIAKKKKKEKNP